MKILYLHGLRSNLSSEKREILEQYGEVLAPDIDYRAEHVQPVAILQQYPETEINVIIGSSMGALNAFIISSWIGRPALLFNPPLAKHPKNPTLPQPKFIRGNAFKQVLLGAKDETVDPKETLTCLGKYLSDHELEVKIDPFLGHRIPPDLFEEQVKIFFSKLCY
ncbi:YqiA/YcfP family alpha/beta fold hydrolase [Salinimicrobium sp. HB62]|uniref:YqiA/YcfP family alpha/beta fold hydrolase n=1 Tax=Salinimicrobium sp. HB62 TaxID=3077781 RepID=UPI002D7980E2|nr:YqiA/YcfP family alpha/beta fold hydrolase [Salinimicrobium sp. HB62]